MFTDSTAKHIYERLATMAFVLLHTAATLLLVVYECMRVCTFAVSTFSFCHSLQQCARFSVLLVALASNFFVFRYRLSSLQRNKRILRLFYSIVRCTARKFNAQCTILVCGSTRCAIAIAVYRLRFTMSHATAVVACHIKKSPYWNNSGICGKDTAINRQKQLLSRAGQALCRTVLLLEFF